MADVEKSYQWLKARDSDDRSGLTSHKRQIQRKRDLTQGESNQGACYAKFLRAST